MKLPQTILKDGFSIEAKSRVHINQTNYVSINAEVKDGFINCNINYYSERDMDFMFYEQLKEVSDAEQFKNSFKSYSKWWKDHRSCECDYNKLQADFKPLLGELDRMIEEAEQE